MQFGKLEHSSSLVSRNAAKEAVRNGKERLAAAARKHRNRKRRRGKEVQLEYDEDKGGDADDYYDNVRKRHF